MRLGVKVVEEGECLKSWIRSGVVAGIRYNGLNSKVLGSCSGNLEAGDGFLPNLAMSLTT